MQDSGTSVQFYYVPVSQVGFGDAQSQPMYIPMQAFPGPNPENSTQTVIEPSACEASTQKDEEKRCKKQRHRRKRQLSLCQKICLGFGVCIGTLSILITVLCLIGTIVIGNTFLSCVNPPHAVHETWHFEPTKIKSIFVDLTAGDVEVYSCSRAKNITISFTLASKEKSRLSKSLSAIQLDEASGSLQLISQFSSFELQHCTAAKVHIIVPTFVRDLSIHVYVDTGRIEFDTQEFSSSTSSSMLRPRLWNDVRLGLHTGVISVKRLAARHSINIDSKLGLVHAKRLEAPFVNVTTTTGAIEIKSVMTSDLKVMTESGAVTVDYLALLGLGRDIANIICEWGIVTLNRFVAVSPTARINISSQSSPIYATLLMDSISGGAFLLHSVSGTIDITETEGGKANLATNTPNFKVGRTSDKLNIPSLVATSHSGPIRLTVKGTTPSH